MNLTVRRPILRTQIHFLISIYQQFYHIFDVKHILHLHNTVEINEKKRSCAR